MEFNCSNVAKFPNCDKIKIWKANLTIFKGWFACLSSEAYQLSNKTEILMLLIKFEKNNLIERPYQLTKKGKGMQLSPWQRKNEINYLNLAD